MVYGCSVFCAVWLGGYCSWPLLSLCPWCAPLVLFGVYDERRIPGTHKTVIEPEQCSTSYGAREMQCSRRHRGGHTENVTLTVYRPYGLRLTLSDGDAIVQYIALQYYSITAIERKGVHIYICIYILKYCIYVMCYILQSNPKAYIYIIYYLLNTAIERKGLSGLKHRKHLAP